MKTVLTSPKFWLALGAAALFSLGVTAQAAGTPTLTILAPQTNQTLSGNQVAASFGLTNFVLTDYQTHSKAVAGQGHIHLWLDQSDLTKSSAIKVAADTYTFENVKPGDHTLVAELVANDHSSLRPPVVATTSFSTAPIQAPAMNIFNTPMFMISILAFLMIAIALYFLHPQVKTTLHRGTPSQKSGRKLAKGKRRK